MADLREIYQCEVCGSVVGTHTRFQQHLSGKKHAAALAERVLTDIENPELNDVDSYYQKYSTELLLCCVAEPPDVALATIQKCKVAMKEAILK